MNALTRIERFDDFIPEVFRRLSQSPTFGAFAATNDIRIDVRENEKEYLVSAEMPGVNKDDIRVSINGNHVSITAEVKKDHEEKDNKSHRVLVKETFHGTVSRGFTLPAEVNRKGAQAKLKDGVLTLTLPKNDGDTGHLIAIQ